MTDVTNSIHVDFDINAEKNTASYLPTVFKVLNSEVTLLDIASTFTTVSAFDTGLNDVNTEATLSGTFEFELYDIITDVIYDDLTLVNPFKIPSEFCTVSSTNPYTFDAKTEFKTANSINNRIGIETTSYIGNTLNVFDDTINTFYVYIGDIDNRYDVPVDLYLSNEKYYSYKIGIFSTVLDLVGLLLDADICMGRTGNFPINTFSTSITTISGAKLNVFSTVNGTKGYRFDVDTASGTMAYTETDCYSSAITNSSGISYDIRTWSLEFGNFFIEDGAFTAASSIAWIDIIDPFCLVDISNSYFMVGSGQVSTYFEPINNGYRMFYDPLDDYIHLGEFGLTAHAQNTYGDILENSYKFLYGGNIEFDDVVDFGSGNQVMVWAKAYNTEQCQQFSTFAYYFETAEFSSMDLGIFINPVGSVDLPITIYPQNTFFFYGGYYTVTISGIKDYSGNILPEYSYRFHIENPLA